MMEKTVLEEQIVSMLTKGLVRPKISVVGCGGAGSNIVSSMYWNSDSEIETIAVNTDEDKLRDIDAHKKILIGKDITQGNGADGLPEVGERCAECARDVFDDTLGDSEIVFVIAGMGGGTGTGAAPILAEVAKEKGAVTFAIAINPFSHEADRCERARDGIDRLKEATETTIVLENDRLLDIAGDMPLRETFSIMERSIMKIIQSVDVKINESFYTQIESDVKDMLSEMNDEDMKNLSQNGSAPMPMDPYQQMDMGHWDMSNGFDTDLGPY
ncbi:MAG: hypothetical protein ACLFPN_04610 [Methanomassiliicoccales archaeon]